MLNPKDSREPQPYALNGLAARHVVELEWHEHHPELGEVDNINPYKALVLERVRRRQWELRGDLAGKKVLEIGCGVGRETVDLAKAGAEVVAIDISPILVETARRRTREAGVGEKVLVELCPAESLSQLRHGRFDVVIGTGVLHHLDLAAFKKVLRSILKDGGTAQFQEPLIHNPLLRLYRLLTPHLRTRTEKPFSEDDVSAFVSDFAHSRVEYHNLVGLIALPVPYVVGRHAARAILRAASRVDGWLQRHWPGLMKYSQYVIIQVR